MSDIETLIVQPLGLTVIRRKITDILKSQSVAQQALATAGAVDPALYNYRVLEEATNPIAHWNRDGIDADNRLPVVNVSMESSAQVQSNSTIANQAYRSVFNVDCFALGIATGQTPGDTVAGLEATRVADLVRHILLSAQFKYLDLRGVVYGRSVQNMDAFTPAINDTAVQRVRCVRMQLSVEHVEVTQQAIGQPIEEIFITALDEDGEVQIAFQIGESP